MKWTRADRLYDRYFEGENDGCTETKTECYENCDGSCSSYSWEEELPFRLKQPIIAPYIFDHTMNTTDFFEGIIIDVKIANSWELEVVLDCPLNVKHLVTIGWSRDCWKVKWADRVPRGFVHRLRKFNNGRVNNVDLMIAKKAKTVKRKK